MKNINEKKYIIGNKDIDASLIHLEMWIRPSDPWVNNFIGLRRPDACFEIIKGRTLIYYLDAKTAKNFIDKSAAVLLQRSRLLEEIKKKTEQITKRMMFLAKNNIHKINKLTRTELIALLIKADEMQTKSTILGTPVAFADIYGAITNRLIEIVKKRKKLKYSIHAYTSILGTPTSKSLTQTAYEKIKNSKKSQKELLDEYFWLEQGYIGRGLSYKELAKIRKNKERKEKSINRDGLLKELRLNKEEKRAFKASQSIIYTKALRVDLRQLLHVIVNRIIDRLSTEFKIEAKYLETLHINELIKVLKGEIKIPKDLGKRFNHSIVYPLGKGSYEIITDEKKIGLFLNRHLIKEQVRDKEIRGQVAHPGLVKGTVKLVFGPQHNSKVKKGDILVSTATSPQLLPAMNRAGAFITDVGGITCHAAIVAREMKKPCVIGTKIATQILKDGDLVEVNANHGLITVIKRC